MSNIIVIKRDGSHEGFEVEKVSDSIMGAAMQVGGEDVDLADELADMVLDILEANEIEYIESSELQKIVEKTLIEEGHAATATEYILKGADRSRMREMDTALMKSFEEITFKSEAESEVKRENANIDSSTAMGTMLKYGSEGAKNFNLLYMMSEDIAEAHKNGDIHIHDLDFLALTETCCQIPVDRLFRNGFNTGHGFLRQPGGIRTAGALAAGLVGTTYGVQNSGLAASVLSLNFDFQIGVRFVLLAVAVFLVILNVLLTIRRQERITVKEIKLDSNKKETKVEEVVVEETEKTAQKEIKAATKKTTTTKGAGKSAGKGSKGKGKAKGKSTGTKGKSTSTKTNKSTKSKNANKAALKDGDVIVAKNECNGCHCLVPADVEGNKTTWPITLVYTLLFVLMVLAFIPWGETGFNVPFFQNVTDAVLEFELFGFPIFAKLLGSYVSFGEWSVTDLIIVMAFMTTLLTFIYISFICI